MTDDEPKSHIHGTIITDRAQMESSSPQNIETTVALTPGQIAAMKERIRQARANLRKPKTPLGRAMDWVLKAFSYDLHLNSAFVPPPTYGVRFDDFTAYIHRKEADADAEAVLEDEEPEVG